MLNISYATTSTHATTKESNTASGCTDNDTNLVASSIYNMLPPPRVDTTTNTGSSKLSLSKRKRRKASSSATTRNFSDSIISKEETDQKENDYSMTLTKKPTFSLNISSESLLQHTVRKGATGSNCNNIKDDLNTFEIEKSSKPTTSAATFSTTDPCCNNNNSTEIIVINDSYDETISNNKNKNNKHNIEEESITKINTSETKKTKNEPKPLKATRKRSTPKNNKNANKKSIHYSDVDFDFFLEDDHEEPKPLKITRKKSTPKKNFNNVTKNNHNNNDSEFLLDDTDEHKDQKPLKATRKKSTTNNTNSIKDKVTTTGSSRKKNDVTSNLCALCTSCSCKKKNNNNKNNVEEENNINEKTNFCLARSNAEIERALIAKLARLEKSIAWFQHLHHKVLLDLKKLRNKYNNNNNNNNTTNDKKKEKETNNVTVVLVPDAEELEEIYEEEEKRQENNNMKTKLVLNKANVQKIVFQATAKNTTKKTYQPSLTQMFTSYGSKSKSATANDKNNSTLLNTYKEDTDNNTHCTTASIEEKELIERTDVDVYKGKEEGSDDGSSSSFISQASDFGCNPRNDSDDDSSRFSFAVAASSSSIFWEAATINNNMHTIASTLSTSLIQMTSNNSNSLIHNSGSGDYSRSNHVVTEKEDSMQTLIELFDHNNHINNDEENQIDTPNPTLFRNIVNFIETGDAGKLKALKDLCPQWKENVEYVLRKTDLVEISNALTEVRKELELTSKQLHVLDFFQFSLQEALNHLQQKYIYTNSYIKG